MVKIKKIGVKNVVNNNDNLTIQGLVTDVQDFAVHDGPGLRVLVFLKGCPLRCGWCQNPESLNLQQEIEYHASICRGCLRCREVCPISGAIVEDKELRIDRSKCTRCMACVGACLGKALVKVGEWMSVEQVVEKITRYKPFFDCSDDGGVTLSGGDPTFQPKFTLSLIEACREQGIHTTVETCGYASYEILRSIVEASNLVIYDIKHMNKDKHIEGTGESNRLILENIKSLCKEVDTEIVVHIPLICGFNDDEENIIKTAEFVASLKKIKHVDILPFNELASGKYNALGLDWKYSQTRQQPLKKLERLQDIIQSYGLEVNIGGLW